MAGDTAHAGQDARHERGSIEAVMADRQLLTDGAEEDLLMGHEPAQADRMHRYAVDQGPAGTVRVPDFSSSRCPGMRR